MSRRASWLATPSIADGFLAECEQAAAIPEKFVAFRRAPLIANVVENRQEDWMDRFLDPVRKILPTEYDRLIEISKLIDAVGYPPIAKPPQPPISPTTAGYLMCYAAMRHLFGALAGMRIVEIGGGFGGQAAVICLAEQVKDYLIVDLMEPSVLQQRFLAALGVKAYYATEPPEETWDLCISSCALSELDEAARNDYANRVLRRSSRGWLAWNYPPGPTPGWIEEAEARPWLADALSPIGIHWGRTTEGYEDIIGSWAQYHFFWGIRDRTALA